jgi:hypothetical protein
MLSETQIRALYAQGEEAMIGAFLELPPVRLEVTEYQAMACSCPGCGARNQGQLPDSVTAGAQYGNRMKGVMAYLNVQNLLPLDHLRWLDGVFQSTGQPWAEDLATLLRKAQRRKVEGRLTPTRLRRIPQRYDELLEQGQGANFHDVRKALARKKKKKGKLVRTTAQRLVARLIRDKEQTLLFLTDPEVPFDNNLAERDLRMMKVKQEGDVLEALTALYAGAPIMPAMA